MKCYVYSLTSENPIDVINLFDTCLIKDGNYYIYTNKREKTILTHIHKKLPLENPVLKKIVSFEKEKKEKVTTEMIQSVYTMLDLAIEELKKKGDEANVK